MESLAFVAALVMLTTWSCAAGGLGLSIAGYRITGAVTGLLAVIMSVSLWRAVPHALPAWLPPLIAGGVALVRVIAK